MDWLNEGPGRQSVLRQRRQEAIELCRDVFGGTLHLRSLKTKYLPTFTKETPANYERRLNAAVLFNAFKRTVRGLGGMVLRKAPKLEEDVPEKLATHYDDIDRSGRDLAAFADDLFTEAWIDGHAIIFVDKPPVPEGATRDEINARPYWIVVRANDVLGFKSDRLGGNDVITSIRWRESVVVQGEEDKYDEKEVPRIREYRLIPSAEDQEKSVVEFEVWELRKSGEKPRWESIETGQLGSRMDEIPVSVAYTNRMGILDSEPPLIDLAAENIRHFQKLSDKDNVEHIACVPIFITKGADDDSKVVPVGAAVGLALPQDGDAKFAETTGEGSKANRESLKDSEHRMALLGLSQLHSESRSAETATSKRIDKSESDSALGLAASSLERALTNAARLHAKWEGIEEGGAIAVNRDFENIGLDPQAIQALADLVPEKMALETFWELLVRGEILPETFDPELERGRLETTDMETLALLRQLRQIGDGDGDE